MANGLVLSGGGAKGDFEVGAVRFLYDSGFRPNVIAGSSVGAINAVKLAEGDSGLPGLEQLWWDLRTNADMFLVEDWFQRQGDLVRGLLGSFLGGGGAGGGSSHISNPISTAVRIFTGIPVIGSIVGLFVEHGIDEAINQLNTFTDTLDGKGPIANGHAPRSFFNLNPIHAKLRSSLSVDLLRRSGIALRLCVVRLQDGKTDFVDEQGRLLGEGGAVVDLFDAVLASAANPAVFPAVDLVAGGQVMGSYTDGGVGELLPIRAAIDAGAGSNGGRIYAVYVSSDLGKVGYVEQGSTPDRPGVEVINLKNIAFRSIDIVNENNFRKSLALAQHPNLTVIQSYYEIHDGETIDPGLIRLNLAYGYLTAWFVKAAEGRNVLWLMLMGSILTEIMKLRRAIWDLEQTFLSNSFIDSGSDADGNPVSSLNHAAVSAFIQQMGLLRRMKAELASDIDAWFAGGGLTSTPYGGGLSPSPVREQPIAWYASWETHNIPADLGDRAPGVFLSAPSDGYRWMEVDGTDSGLVLPAVDPPAIALRVSVSLPASARQGQPLTFSVGTVDATSGVPVKSSLTVDGQPVQQTSGQPIDWTFHGDVHSVGASAPNFQPASTTFNVPQSLLRLDVTSDPPQTFPLDKGTTLRLTVKVFDAASGQELQDAAISVNPGSGNPVPLVEGLLSDPINLGYRAVLIARRADYSDSRSTLVYPKGKESKEDKDGKEGKESINKEAFKDHEVQSPLGPPRGSDLGPMIELLNQRMSRVESLIGQSRTFIAPEERPVVGPPKKPA
jgi:predicted acylesterase/phospholipase RssA